ncbi:hypothetical protein BJV77DRAFT_737858 [Russula vinacea]|nr:hypothetical protein BJV77DRAFT_737858 [Russula vinacea]
MSTLLVLASKVEAAVQTYLEVRDSVDKKKWRKKLDKERASVVSEINRIKQETGESRPALHPTLVALFIVLSRDEDLGRITRSHPDRKQHKYFRRREVFPEDISNLLPPREGRWWEDLGMLSKIVIRFILTRFEKPRRLAKSDAKMHIQLRPLQLLSHLEPLSLQPLLSIPQHLSNGPPLSSGQPLLMCLPLSLLCFLPPLVASRNSLWARSPMLGRLARDPITRAERD